MSRKQVVKFSKVVTNYVADVATRMANNEAAGGELIAVNIAKGASDAIREELDERGKYE